MALSRKKIKERKRQKKRRLQLMAVVLIGIGLIVFTAAGTLVFSNRDAQPIAVGETTEENEAVLPRINSVTPVIVDIPAPDLGLENINGKKESLEDFLGQVVLVNNWAIWCPPCKAELPHMEAYYHAHKDEGFSIVAVEAGGTESKVQSFLSQTELSFNIWLDPRQDSIAAIGNGNLPNSYVIDREGQVRLAWTGAINLEALETYITPLIEE